MEALNAVGLSPLSVLAKRRQPRKNLSLATLSQFKQNFPNFSVSRSLQGGLMMFSSFLSSELARALTYEEALQQSVNSDSSSIPDIDVSGFLDNVFSFASDNPIIVGGVVAVAAVPLVVSQLLSKPKAWGVETAKSAYAKLGDDAGAQLLDIRALPEIKEGGSPNIRGLKKKPVALVYKGDDKPGFLNKLSSRFKEPESTTLFILDKFDGNSELVAELVTVNGFKAAYAIKDGAEGPRGWKNSGLPWILPKKGFSLDLSSLTDYFGEAFDAVPVALGFAVASGLGLLAYTEVETILQVLGTAALVQFVNKKLLFAEDRKQTVQQIEEVLNTKVAPKEIVGDIQQIGKALLPPIVISKTLPAPTQVKTSGPSDSAVQKPESVAEVNIAPPKVEASPEVNSEANSAPPKVEAAPEVNSEANSAPPKVEAAPEVNSVPKAQVQEESLPVLSTSLSPYPNYPDFKPPSSPMPSQP
ncbi:hypothetical protein ACS0TY_002387 [Phlomoides rotata]